ncbi:MAG: dTDP-4-dehydrorhamnose reductase [Paludibacteraceae bacterium]|nr:dTDP-4-dehydrorhamnose reductase [Paludibacteraceae bacterium]
MRILVTGCNGQLGNEMRLALVGRPAEVFFCDIDTLDLTKPFEVEQFVDKNQITHIVNCAAYTSVDKAEDDRLAAANVNINAVHNIAMAALRHDIKVVHISTDYVFEGNACVPYEENMPAIPRTVYGKTKFAGEQTLIAENPNSIILRTAWLYSSFGNNFVKTMLKNGREREELNVVYDQVGSPTYAADLAEVIVKIMFEKDWKPGVYHFTNSGVCSWFDFTKAIMRIAGIECKINPILSSEYKYRTPRPPYSVLNTRKIRREFDIEIPYWLDSLERCIGILKHS